MASPTKASGTAGTEGLHAQHSVPPATSPPPIINTNSRPQPKPSNSGYAPPAMGSASSYLQDPVTSLAHNFAHHGISPTSAQATRPDHGPSISPPFNSSNPSSPGPNTSYSGPQAYPASHDAMQSQVSPYVTTNQTHPSHRPAGQSSNPSSPPPTAALASDPTQAPGSWSRGQWPPPEWNVHPASPQSPQKQSTLSHSAYPGQAQAPQGANTGANLNRPNSYNASSHAPSGTSLRPHASMSSASGRPQFAQQQFSAGVDSPPSGSPYPSSSSSYKPPTPTSQYTIGGSSYNPPTSPSGPSPTMPSFPTGPNISPYPSMGSYPSQGNYSYPSMDPNSSFSGSHFASPLHGSPSHSPMPMTSPGGNYSPSSYSPHGGPSGYSPPGGHSPYNPMQGPYFPNQPYSSAPLSSSPGSYRPAYLDSSHSAMPTFPHAQGGNGGYFGEPSGPPTSQYSMPSFPGQSGGLHPIGATSATPAPPPTHPAHSRPPTQSPYTAPSATGTGLTSSGPLGFALSAVDRVAGKKTREQLENQVGNLAQTGSKLFGKFTNSK
ncbi:hypothetical protein BD779DRAFT_1554722 [Infundibulicybe gibba]|nr:hypothetical protein BD779DRAFT_1554722 [Infundibulicybe gibba]